MRFPNLVAERRIPLADYYLEFSQVISHLTVEEFDWLGQELEINHVLPVLAAEQNDRDCLHAVGLP